MVFPPVEDCLIFCKDGWYLHVKNQRVPLLQRRSTTGLSGFLLLFLATAGFASLESFAGTPALDFVGFASWLEVVRSLLVHHLMDISIILMEPVAN